DVALQNAWQVALLLRVGAELDEEGADHEDAEGRERRGAGQLQLLREDEARGDVEAGAAMLHGPVRRGPALGGEDAVPLHDLVVGEVAVDGGLLAEVRGHGRAEEGPDLLAKAEVLGQEGEVHEAGSLVQVPGFRTASGAPLCPCYA